MPLVVNGASITSHGPNFYISSSECNFAIEQWNTITISVIQSSNMAVFAMNGIPVGYIEASRPFNAYGGFSVRAGQGGKVDFRKFNIKPLDKTDFNATLGNLIQLFKDFLTPSFML